MRQRTVKKRYQCKKGGSNNSEYALPPTPDMLPPPEKPVVIPTLADNVQAIKNIASSAVTNVMADGVKRVADGLHIDPTKDTMPQLAQRATQVVKALDSPEGQELKADASALLKDTVEVLAPSVDKAAEVVDHLVQKQIPIAGDALNTLILATPAVGQVVAAVEEAGNVARSVENATKSMADLTAIGSEAAHNLSNQQERALSLYERIQQTLGTALAGVQRTVDSYGSSLKGGARRKTKQKRKRHSYKKTLKHLIGGRLQQSLDDWTNNSHLHTSL